MSFTEVVGLKLFKHAIAVATLSGLLFGLSGCFETKEDTTPPKLPTGTIQGKLLDSMTQQPIAGASINIGGTTAITDADGKYVISNVVVPADVTKASGHARNRQNPIRCRCRCL